MNLRGFALPLVLFRPVFGAIDTNDICSNTYRGWLQYPSLPGEPYNEVIKVVLDVENLILEHGGKTKKIKTAELGGPIHISEIEQRCLEIPTIGKKKIETVCCATIRCRDEWWIALSRMMLCANQKVLLTEKDESDGDLLPPELPTTTTTTTSPNEILIEFEQTNVIKPDITVNQKGVNVDYGSS